MKLVHVCRECGKRINAEGFCETHPKAIVDSIRDEQKAKPIAKGIFGGEAMSTYAIRGLSWREGTRVYFHQETWDWRPIPPPTGLRLSLKETRDLTKKVGGRVVRFTTRRERTERLVEAAYDVWVSCQNGRMGLSGHSLEPALRPFLCGNRYNPGIGAGRVLCHDDDGEVLCPCILMKRHAPPCRCVHGSDS